MKLQFITHTNSTFDTVSGAVEALKGGCRWIQIRMKDAPEGNVLATALELKPICESYGATLIVDDHVDVCLKADIDGVHLGKEDMAPADARMILGPNKIIGGTSNTIEDIRHLVAQGVNYIGLGPFRFTSTKKNLSAIIGLEGYREILGACKREGISTPIVAIGGITIGDIPAIMETGVSGIALSSTILNAESPKAETELILDAIG